MIPEVSAAMRLAYFVLGMVIGALLFLAGVWLGWRWGVEHGVTMAREDARQAAQRREDR